MASFSKTLYYTLDGVCISILSYSLCKSKLSSLCSLGAILFCCTDGHEAKLGAEQMRAKRAQMQAAFYTLPRILACLQRRATSKRTDASMWTVSLEQPSRRRTARTPWDFPSAPAMSGPPLPLARSKPLRRTHSPRPPSQKSKPPNMSTKPLFSSPLFPCRFRVPCPDGIAHHPSLSRCPALPSSQKHPFPRANHAPMAQDRGARMHAPYAGMPRWHASSFRPPGSMPFRRRVFRRANLRRPRSARESSSGERKRAESRARRDRRARRREARQKALSNR